MERFSNVMNSWNERWIMNTLRLGLAALGLFAMAGISAPLALADETPRRCTRATVPSGIDGIATHQLWQGIVPDPAHPQPTPVVAGGTIVIRDAKTGKEVAKVKTDNKGHFKVDLRAGEYKLEAKSGVFVYNAQVKVTRGKRLKLKAHFRVAPDYRGPFPPSIRPVK